MKTLLKKLCPNLYRRMFPRLLAEVTPFQRVILLSLTRVK